MLMKPEYLGQYGKILKIIINKPILLGQNRNQFSVYVTFQNQKEAMVCRLALEEFKFQNSQIKASFGTTKYCSYFISKQKCMNIDCLYLHSFSQSSDVYQQVPFSFRIKYNKVSKSCNNNNKNISSRTSKNSKINFPKRYLTPFFLPLLPWPITSRRSSQWRSASNRSRLLFRRCLKANKKKQKNKKNSTL